MSKMTEDKVRKRRRDNVGGSRTPLLVISPTGVFASGNRVLDHENSDGNDRPRKRIRGESKIDDIVSSPSVTEIACNCCCHKPVPTHEDLKKRQNSDLIKKLPGDVVAHCLSYLGSTEDRHALQNTCKLFRAISNSVSMLSSVDVFGDLETGKGGIIQENDTPSTASGALARFARAGNLQALYMLGIVKCYCYQDLKNGILMLKIASSRGFVRSSYTLGIILRDALVEEAARFMKIAASRGYFPALQEILPAREMKERFGEPNADELRRHLDPVGLNRLLLRDYVNSAELRGMNTSHCWNPLCGKWAYKASNNGSSANTINSSNTNNSNNSNLPLRRSAATQVQPTYDVDENMLESSSSNNNDDGTVFPQRGGELQGPFGTLNYSNGFNDRLQRMPHHHHHAFDSVAVYLSKDRRVGLTASPKVTQVLAWNENGVEVDRVARMKSAADAAEQNTAASCVKCMTGDQVSTRWNANFCDERE
eukprot:CAMPEP_0172366930 /NCGR_PEP_ID=MMETSP1060-20121228/17637_1 /TAXON_ID=37318 /ORGANISM="Pseudo-nitzschia pungens, Strain cf. cingulata" /LENGTH=479 /DNA_ID=CAMNT_0013090963 /DNA_START=107 /DNA_END=1547 /DNA_ORIENTATION=-